VPRSLRAVCLVALAAVLVAPTAWAQDAGEPLPKHAKLRLAEGSGRGRYRVEHLVPSLDGSKVAVGQGGTVRVFELAEGRLERSIDLGEETTIWSLAFSSDGAALFAGSFTDVRAFELATGKEGKRLEPPSPNDYSGFSLSRDGSVAVASNRIQRRIEVWDVATRTMTGMAAGSSGFAQVGFSHDGSRFVCPGGPVRLLSTADLRELGRFTFDAMEVALDKAGKTLLAHGIGLTVADFSTGQTLYESKPKDLSKLRSAAALSPDGKIVAAGLLGEIRLLDARSGRELGKLEGPRGFVTELTFVGDGGTLVSAEEDGEILVWETAPALAARPRTEPTPVAEPARDAHGATLPEHATARLGTIGFRGRLAPDGLAVSPDGAWIACGHDDALVVWETATGRKLRTLHPSIGFGCSIAFSSDGSRLACTAVNGREVQLWETGTWRALPAVSAPGHRGQPGAVAYSPGGELLVALGTARNGKPGISAWDTASGRLIYDRDVERWGEDALSFVADGTAMVTVGPEWEIEFRNPKDGQVASTVPGVQAFGGFAMSPDGARCAVQGKDESVVDILGGDLFEPLVRLGEPKAGAWPPVEAIPLAFSRRGHVVVKVRSSIRVYDAEDGKLLARRETGPGDSPKDVAVSADGRTLVWSGEGPMLHVARLPGLEPASKATGHIDAITAVRVLAGGKVAMTASADGTVRTWDIGTGAHRKVIARVDSPIDAFDLSPDGRRIALAGKDLGVVVLGLGDGRAVLQLREREQIGYYGPQDVAFAGGSDSIVVLRDGRLELVQVDTGAASSIPFKGETGYSAHIERLTDGRVFVARKSHLGVFDPATGELARTLPGVSGTRGASTDPAHTVVAIVAATGDFEVWDVATSARRFGKPAVEGWFGASAWKATAVSPDGRLVAAYLSGGVMVWDAVDGTDVATFACAERASVTSVAFTPDATSLVVGCNDTTALVFGLPTSWDVDPKQVCRENLEFVGAAYRRYERDVSPHGGASLFLSFPLFGRENVLLCPADAQAAFPSTAEERRARSNHESIDLANPPRGHCSYAVRDLARFPADRKSGKTAPVLACCPNHDDGVFFLHTDGSVVFRSRADLGLPEGLIEVGPAAKHPELRKVVYKAESWAAVVRERDRKREQGRCPQHLRGLGSVFTIIQMEKPGERFEAGSQLWVSLVADYMAPGDKGVLRCPDDPVAKTERACSYPARDLARYPLKEDGGPQILSCCPHHPGELHVLWSDGSVTTVQRAEWDLPETGAVGLGDAATHAELKKLVWSAPKK
jgi:WD40 repeat protein